MISVLVLLAVPIAVFIAAVGPLNVRIEVAGKYVDAVFKIVVTIVSAAWVLNRYFTGRTDVTQVRIDPEIDVVPPGSFVAGPLYGLLLYRLDVVNTGRTQLADYRIQVEIASVEVDETGNPEWYDLAEIAWHDGAPIEPGSWAALSDAVAYPSSVKAVRFVVAIEPRGQPAWSWHRTFSIGSAT